MAKRDYSGSWAKGFASTFAQAPSMIMNALEWKARKKAQKKIDDAVEELKLNSTELARKYDMARADGTITQQEYSDAVSWAMPLGNEILSRVEKLYGDYQGFSQKQIDNELADIKAFYELSSDLDFQNIEQMRAFGSRLTQPKAKIQWDSIIKSIESRQAQPEDIWGQAGKLPMDIRDEYLRSKGIDIPKAETPITEKAPTNIEERIAGINKLEKAGIITKERANESRAKIYGGVMPEETTARVEPKAETVTTLKNWEKMFDIKAEEGPKTEEEYNRALNLLAQSEDRYKPKYATWKEALIAEVKGIGKELKGITDKGDYNLLLNIYMQKLEEIKTKYPDVDLNQFPEFEEQKNWFEKLKEKVGL